MAVIAASRFAIHILGEGASPVELESSFEAKQNIEAMLITG
jgi:hypothetical protein